MRRALILPALLLPVLSGGCVRTVAAVATAPFKAAGQVVDWTTTSQDEADRNYGRKAREKEAREGRERRAYQKRCRKDPDACEGYDGYQAALDN
jgi:uncharacterized cupredoxin-like copper-binding protein